MLSILTLPTHQHEISFCHWVKMKPNQGSQVSNLVSRAYRTDTWRKVIIVFSTSLYTYGNTRHIRTEKSHSSTKDCLCCFEIYSFSFFYWVTPILLTFQIRGLFCVLWILLELNQILHSFASDSKHVTGREHLRGPCPLSHRAGRTSKSHEDEQLCGGVIGDKEKQNGLCTMKWRRTGDLKVVKNTLIWVPCAAKWGHGDVLACSAS